MGARRVCVFVDPHLASMDSSPVQVVLESLRDQKVNYQVYDKVRVEVSY